MQINVLLVESEVLTSVGLKTILEKEEKYKVVGEATDAEKGLEQFEALKPDVTILSLRIGNTCAVDYLERYFEIDQGAKIIVLANHAGDAEIKQALKKGALGYICKDISIEQLLKAVGIVNSGNRYIPNEIANILSENLGQEELTRTEGRVLQMLVGGMSNKEIGFAYDISENTVKTHVKHIFEKLGVSDRTTATTTAIKRGLVRIDI